MKFDSSLAGFILALITALSGWVVWWLERINTDKKILAERVAEESARAADAAKKEYAAQRDFEHLKNNLKNITDGVGREFKDVNERFDDVERYLSRIEAYLIRVTGIPPIHHDKDNLHH